MSTQQFYYPASSVAVVSIGAQGTNGQAAPALSLEMGGVDGSNILRALSVDSTGKLNVNISGGIADPLPVSSTQLPAALGQTTMALSLPVTIASNQSTLPISAASLPLPTGAATSALQTQISGQIPTTLGQHAMAASLSIAIASDQSTVPVSAASLPLPSGAATEATLSTLNGKFGTLGQKAMVGSSPVVIASDQSAIPVSAASLPLPSGAATEATLSAMSAKLPATLGQHAMAASMSVALASDQSSIPVASYGNTPLQFVRNDYSSVNVTTSAYTQLIASTSGITNVLEIFDSSGQTLKIAFGAAASEVDKFIVVPGGNGRMTVNIPAGTRISIKALSGNATSGEIDLNLYT